MPAARNISRHHIKLASQFSLFIEEGVQTEATHSRREFFLREIF